MSEDRTPFVDDSPARAPRAFPSAAIDDRYGGMDLLDWFAGQALAVAWDARDKGYFEGDDNDMARCAYQIAEAMMAERAKRNG